MSTANAERRVHAVMQQPRRKLAPGETSGSASHTAFLVACALLFAIAAAATVAMTDGRSMRAMGAMPMSPGGPMSMAPSPMSAQMWAAAAASFTGGWAVMMIAMMMPSVAPLLWRYRRDVQGTGETRLDTLTTALGAAYISSWIAFGLPIFLLGAALARVAILLPATARAASIATGAVLAIAGTVQLTTWKGRHLRCCRDVLSCGRALAGDAATAWRLGLRYGLHCIQCCAPLTAILLALGVMDRRVMVIITLAITAERLAPNGARVARAIGAVAIASGLVVLARASGLA